MNVVRVNGINNVNSNQGYKNQQSFGVLSVSTFPVSKTQLVRKAEACSSGIQERLRTAILKHLKVPTEVMTDGDCSFVVKGEKGMAMNDFSGRFIETLCDVLEKLSKDVKEETVENAESLDLEGVIRQFVPTTKSEHYYNLK